MIYQGYDLRWSRANPMSIEVGVGENKGKLPEVLSGLFTNRVSAIKVIDTYLSTKKVKDKANGETDAESGSKELR